MCATLCVCVCVCVCVGGGGVVFSSSPFSLRQVNETSLFVCQSAV